MVIIKNPGTIVKNKNGIISLKIGRSNVIIRSVIINIKKCDDKPFFGM